MNPKIILKVKRMLQNLKLFHLSNTNPLQLFLASQGIPGIPTMNQWLAVTAQVSSSQEVDQKH